MFRIFLFATLFSILTAILITNLKRCILIDLQAYRSASFKELEYIFF